MSLNGSQCWKILQDERRVWFFYAVHNTLERPFHILSPLHSYFMPLLCIALCLFSQMIFFACHTMIEI